MDIKNQILKKVNRVVCLVFPDKGGVSLLGAALLRTGSHIRYSAITLDQLAFDLDLDQPLKTSAAIKTSLLSAIQISLNANLTPIIIINERDFKYLKSLARDKAFKICLKEHSCHLSIGLCDSYSGESLSEYLQLELLNSHFCGLKDCDITAHPGMRFCDEAVSLHVRCASMDSYSRFLYYLDVMEDDPNLAVSLSVYFTSDFSRFLMPTRELHAN